MTVNLPITDPFTGTNGSAWNASYWGSPTGGGTIDIQSNSGRLLTPSGDYSPVAIFMTGATPNNDTDLTFDITITNPTTVEQYPMVAICTDGTAQSPPYHINVGYEFLFDLGNSRVTFSRNDATNGFSLITDAAFTYSAGVLHVEITRVGNLFEVFVWYTGGKPGTPLISTNDFGGGFLPLGPGVMGFLYDNGGGTGAETLTVDNLTIIDPSAPAASGYTPQQRTVRRLGWLPRRRARSTQPVKAGTAAPTQALPPQQPRRVSKGWLPRSHARQSQPVQLGAVVVTVQALPAQPARKLRPLRPRARVEFTTPIPTVTVTVPQRSRRRGLPLRRRGFTTQPTPTVTVTNQALPPQPVRKLQPLRLRTRSEFTQPVAAGTPAPTLQALPPQPARRHLLPVLHAKPRVSAPPLSVTIIVTTQPLPPQPSRRRLVPLLRRRTLTPLPLVGNAAPPPVVVLPIIVTGSTVALVDVTGSSSQSFSVRQ